MRIFAHIIRFTVSMREFFIPSYQPERHYMRGPGPACARSRNGMNFG